MHQKRITIPEYERDFPPAFNPVKYDPAAWVAMAKAAGMKYITITSKHHDGFAMYDSKVSDYDIVERTPYGKDVLKMLADECRKAGHQALLLPLAARLAPPRLLPARPHRAASPAATRRATGTATSTTWTRSCKELLTGYGEIGGIWFDGCGTSRRPTGGSGKTYKLIHDLQPAALVGSNHHRKPFPGEDFQMFEKDLPGHNTAGLQRASRRSATLPFEMCDTINNSWGYNKNDGSYKSTKQIVQLPGEGGGLRRQLPAERRAAARRHDPARVREAAGRGGRLAEGERRDDLRHARRAAAAAAAGA